MKPWSICVNKKNSYKLDIRDLINTYTHDVKSFDATKNTERFNRVAQPPQIIQGWTVAAYSWLIKQVK